MSNSDIADERVKREREAYNRGLSRESLDKALSHADGFFQGKTAKVLSDAFQSKNGGDFLELGSTGWTDWIEAGGIRPGRLVCINVSERELEAGVKASADTVVKPEFALMDAHKLTFADSSFDVVYGSGILHHLDLERALLEVQRVLRPGGIAVFGEPLSLNPVAWLVRRLTPSARTEDERPLGFADIKLFGSIFDTEFHYNQLFSVAAGVISGKLFSTPHNTLMKAAFAVDEALVRALPLIGPYYRNVIFVGHKKF